MKSAGMCLALAVLLAPFGFAGQAASEPKPAVSAAAEQLFKAGNFAEAGKIYAHTRRERSQRLYGDPPARTASPLPCQSARRCGELAEEGHRRCRPDDADAKVMLAEAYYRSDDFQRAAAALNGVDVGTNKLLIEQYPTLNVAMLESFKGETPYEIEADGEATSLKFIGTGPLPVVNVRVNGGDEVTFFIDTGGSEVALDPEFATELGLPQFGDRCKAHSPAASMPSVRGVAHLDFPHHWRLDRQEPARGNAPAPPTLKGPWRQAHRRRHRHDAVLPFPRHPRLSTTASCVLRRKDAAKPASNSRRSHRRRASRFRSGWRATTSWWAGAGWRPLPPTLLFVDTGPCRRRGQARGIGDQGRRHQARAGQGLRRRGWRREAENRALHRGSAFPRRH